jgi:hypothetical protein
MKGRGRTSSPLGNVDDSLELELTLDREVLDGKVVLPVVGERLVERRVLLGGDVLRVSGPKGLSLVELLVLGGGLERERERRKEGQVRRSDQPRSRLK